MNQHLPIFLGMGWIIIIGLGIRLVMYKLHKENVQHIQEINNSYLRLKK